MKPFVSNAWPFAPLALIAAALFSRGDARGFVAGAITVAFPFVVVARYQERYSRVRRIAAIVAYVYCVAASIWMLFSDSRFIRDLGICSIVFWAMTGFGYWRGLRRSA